MPVELNNESLVEEGQNLGDYIARKLHQARVIYLKDDIDDFAAGVVCSQLETLARESSEPITLLITSPGGSVFSSLAIYDTIRRLRETRGVIITAEARGYAASGAALLMQAANQRVATKNTRLLIHEVSTLKFFETEKASDVEEEAEELNKVNDMAAQILAVRSGHSLSEIKKLWRKKDVWMSAEEAMQWGLIDEVV